MKENPIHQFARLFGPIEDLPGVVYEETELRSRELKVCLGPWIYFGECHRFELQCDCLALPRDLDPMVVFALYAVPVTDFVIVLFILLFAPPLLHSLAFAWLLGCPWVLAAVVKKILARRARFAAGSLSVAVTSDGLVLTLGSGKASIGIDPPRGVVVREFHGPDRTRYAVHLRSGDFIVPIGGWINWETVLEMAKTLSETLSLPLALEYVDIEPDSVYGRSFSAYYPSGHARLLVREKPGPGRLGALGAPVPRADTSILA